MGKDAKDQLEALNQHIKELAGVYKSALSSAGASENEFWIWYSLIAMEECSQQDICNAWSLSKQTVNSIMANMVRKGHVRLESVPGRRNKVIHLTDEGRTYGENLVTPISNAELTAFERLTREDQEAFTAIIDRYVKFLREELETEDAHA